MPKTFDQRMTPWALWARRFALFSVQFIAAGILLHRFGPLATPVLLNMLLVGFGAALVAVVLAIVAFAKIWRTGEAGLTAGVFACLIGLGVIAWPAAYAPAAFKLPPINDVTTDTATPPKFVALAKLRDEGANPAGYQGARIASLQTSLYPDIKPMLVTRPLIESFELTREIVRRLKWTVVAERPPQPGVGPAKGTASGEIEAEAKTSIMGFRDDVVIRFTGEQDKTRIDIRSASRYGTRDLGRNAQRVRALMKELHTRLDLGIPLDVEIGRRKDFRSKLLRGRDRVSEAPRTQPNPSQPASRRERAQKPEPPSRDEGRARDKRRRQQEE